MWHESAQEIDNHEELEYNSDSETGDEDEEIENISSNSNEYYVRKDKTTTWKKSSASGNIRTLDTIDFITGMLLHSMRLLM